MATTLSEPGARPGLLARALQPSLEAARKNVAPAILLWCFSIGVIAAYYQLPTFRAVMEQLVALKQRVGLPYSIISTILFGALAPIAVCWLFPSRRERLSAREWTFLLCFWGYIGIEVEYFYRFQAWLFGDSADAMTVLTKVAFDVGFLSTVYFVPRNALIYLWRNSDFSWRNTRAALGPEPITSWYIPNIITNAAVWLPGTVCIYLLPQPLQMPVQNFILCLYVLMLALLNKREV